jgi:hypothetical protein
MHRLIAIVCAAVALHPAAVIATPSPSPALADILAKPPTADYVETAATAPGALEGQFDAHTFVMKTEAPNGAAVEQTLATDGFVDGYWRTWIQKSGAHILAELVMAFSGGDGAKHWLAGAEKADKADSNYLHSLSIGGIDRYYGAHFYYTSNHNYGDWYAFVKGNDYFGVIVVSPKDDLGTTAADQTKVQYTSAPSATIPQSEWPASTTTTTHSFAYNVGYLLPWVLVGAIVLGIVLFIVGRSRRRQTFAAAVPGAAPAPAVQMSQDGAFWWDGQSWRDAQHEVPPAAERSPDGAFWWDGQKWRPVS